MKMLANMAIVNTTTHIVNEKYIKYSLSKIYKVCGWLVKLILKFLKTIYFLHIYLAIDPVPKVNEEYFPLLCTHDFH